MDVEVLAIRQPSCHAGTREQPRGGELGCSAVSALSDPPALGRDDVIHARMSKAADEMSHWAEYDYVVINREVLRAFEDVCAILAAERLKRKRQTGLSAFVRSLQAGL